MTVIAPARSSLPTAIGYSFQTSSYWVHMGLEEPYGVHVGSKEPSNEPSKFQKVELQ